MGLSSPARVGTRQRRYYLPTFVAAMWGAAWVETQVSQGHSMDHPALCDTMDERSVASAGSFLDILRPFVK